MTKKHFFLFLIGVLWFNFSFAQGINVNPLTGSASTQIPIYSLSSGQVSMPISLVYSGSGVKVKDVESSAGMNWQLVAGGQISRQVRGLPDDCTKDTLSNTALGWMSSSNTAVAAIKAFSIANNGGLTCSNETTDISYINSHFPSNYDTEPDIFYVNAPGLSCQLVYDPDSAKFRSISQQDLVISYTTVGGSGYNASVINSFSIKNDKGVTYIFGEAEMISQGTTLGTGGTATYLATKYQQYLHGIKFADSWYLTSINDVSGNSIQLTYATALPRNSTDPVLLYIGGSTSPAVQYFVKQTVSPKTLSTITANNANSPTQHISVSFTWASVNYSNMGGTGQTVISSITAPGRTFSFGYTPVASSTGYTRYFLRNFSDAGCSSPVNYKFSYVGETKSPTGAYSTTLPDSLSTKIDYWGYYAGTAGTSTLIPSVYVNPFNFSYQRYLIKVSASPGAIYAYSLNNNNRGADPTTVATGALSKITYIQGGSTNIVYESNDYYDTPSLSAVQGGGIRVKQTIDSVGNGATNNIVHNYSYLNPSGVSSGIPIALPSYAFTIPYSGSNTGNALWTSATALSAYDLSSEDHTIMYEYVKSSQTGAGSTAYQYTVPATYWDIGSAPSCSGCSGNEWYPTMNLIGRSNCALPIYGPITNYIYSYPFIPNPNYDFERGLPIKVTNYNDSGTEVSETNYTYQRSATPSAITAFKNDDNSNGSLLVRSYNKYTVYYNTSELTTTVISKVFDSKLLTTAQSDTTTYTYGSTRHKLLTQVQKTNSNRSIATTKITYTKDYTSAAGANSYVNALYYLKQQNINIPVETYQQITRGATTVTTGASLTLFNPFTTGATTSYLPLQQLNMTLPDGGSFTPYSVVGTVPQSSTYDSKYYPVANYTYDNTGYPLTVDDANKNKATTVTDHYTNQPAAIFKNVAAGEFAFKDYDSYPAPSIIGFTTTGSGSYTPVGSHAGSAAGVASTQTVISGAITKNTIAKNYIFSIWINAVTPGTMTVAVSGLTPNRTISYSGGWKYYELKLPAATISSSITVAITTDHNISIDDILFYPDIADVGTVTYDPTTHFKIASTDANGVSAYYSYDQWGRLLYQFDQDKNIIQKNTYITAANVQDFVKPVLNHSPGNTSITTTTPVTFSTSSYTDACTMAGFTYTWNFGDGTGDVVTTSAVAPAHTYTTPTPLSPPTPYIGSLTVSSPFFGSKTADTVNIFVKQAIATLSYHDYAVSAGITSIVFSDGTHTYTYTGGQLNGGQVPPGSYTITVTPVGGAYDPGTGKGYTNMVFSDGVSGQCFPRTGSPFIFTWTVVADRTLDFSIYNNNTCPFN